MSPEANLQNPQPTPTPPPQPQPVSPPAPVVETANSHLESLKNSPANPNVNPAQIPLNMDKVSASLGAYLKSKLLILIPVLIVAVALSILNPIFGVLIVVAALYLSKSLYEKTMFSSFAASNNFEFDKNGVVPPQTGHLFYIGNSNKIRDVIKGHYSDRDFLMFLYSYDIGYGRNRQSYHRAVITMSYGVNLPTFILRRPGFKAMLEEEGDKITANGYSEKLELEGDFNKDFSVFIPKDTAQDVLTILTPDVMQLLQPLNKYEIELTPTGDFYLYTFKYITKKQELVDIYKIVEAISLKIGNQAELQKHVIRNIIRSADPADHPVKMPVNPLEEVAINPNPAPAQ